MYNFYEDEREESRVYEFMTPREVMEELGIGKNKFYAMAQRGELPAFRLGKLWRVRRLELENWRPQKS